MSDDLVDRLRLVRSPGIGPVTYRQLIARFGSASAALDAVPDLAARGGGKAPRLQITLLELNLAGRLDRHAGGKVSIRPA